MCLLLWSNQGEHHRCESQKKHVSPRVRLIKEAQNTNSVDKLRKLVGMPVDNNNYLCDTNFLRYRKRKLTGGYLNLETSRLTD